MQGVDVILSIYSTNSHFLHIVHCTQVFTSIQNNCVVDNVIWHHFLSNFGTFPCKIQVRHHTDTFLPVNRWTAICFGCKIQKNWCIVTVVPTIDHHGGQSQTPANQSWDQVSRKSQNGCQNVLLLYCWCHSDSASVLLYFTALYRSFLKRCTLTNKAVGTIWRALSKPPQRRQGPDPHPLWLLVGTPSAIGPELVYRLHVAQPTLMDVSIFLIYFYITIYVCVPHFYDLSALVGCWSSVSIRRIIYKFLNVCPFDYTAVAVSGKVERS